MAARWIQNSGETFESFVKRFQKERETKPNECSHCLAETDDLVNHSRSYGGNVGAHWLCPYCRITISASVLGAGGNKDQTVADVAAIFNLLEKRLKESL